MPDGVRHTVCKRGHVRSPDNVAPNGNCITCKNEHSRKHSKTNRTVCRDATKRAVRKLKDEVITAYGAKCACCGESIRQFLTLDHMHGGGNDDRSKSGGQLAVYRLVRNLGFPPEYQVLCFNCNSGRAINAGICPHKDTKCQQT